MPDKTAKGAPKFRVGQVVRVRNRNWWGRIWKITRYPAETFDLLHLEHDGVPEGWNIYSSHVLPVNSREIGKRRKVRHDG